MTDEGKMHKHNRPGKKIRNTKTLRYSLRLGRELNVIIDLIQVGKANILISQGHESLDDDSSNLNSSLTHFLIMSKDMAQANQVNFVNHLELRLSRSLVKIWRKSSLTNYSKNIIPIPSVMQGSITMLHLICFIFLFRQSNIDRKKNLSTCYNW